MRVRARQDLLRGRKNRGDGTLQLTDKFEKGKVQAAKGAACIE
jgi:hypothetical protein